MKNMILNNKVT